jgi:hypothetical protein
MILNDPKSSTYKLALLRVIARVADSAAGLAVSVSDDRVRIPLGVVALFWVRMFKPVLASGFPQTPASRGLDGLGFVRQGFRDLLRVPSQDLRIGASLWGDYARALRLAVADAARTIVRMTANFTTYADGRPVFPVRFARGPRATDRVIVDADWLWRIGEFEVRRHLWDGLRHLNVWIEPVITAEWTRLMQGYGARQGVHPVHGRPPSEPDLAGPGARHPARPDHRDRTAGQGRAGTLRLVGQAAGRAQPRHRPLLSMGGGLAVRRSLEPAAGQPPREPVTEEGPDAATLASARDRIVDWSARGYRGAETGPIAERFVREAASTLAVAQPRDDTHLLDDVFGSV